MLLGAKQTLISENSIIPVNYIEGNGAIIDTQHYPTLNTSMEFEMMPIDYTGASYIGFTPSTSNNNDNTDFRFFATNNNTIYFDFTNRRIQISQYSLTNVDWYIVNCSNNRLSLVNTSTGYNITNSGNAATQNPAHYPIFIFGDQNGQISQQVNFKLKYLKIYEDGQLVKFLKAAKRFDGEIGFYDFENKVWYGSENENKMLAY